MYIFVYICTKSRIATTQFVKENDSMARKSTKANMYDRIYSSVRNDIIGGKYSGGSFLIESDLCEQFGVSRTPVREALIRLAQDNFLELVPNRGAFIPHITINDIIELCDLRGANEGLAAMRCASHASEPLIQSLEASIHREEALLGSEDPDSAKISEEDFFFHALLKKGCGNSRLEHTLDLIDNQMKRFTNISADRLAVSATLPVSLQFHRQALEAIRTGDTFGAQTALIQHWSSMLHGYIERDLSGLLDTRL